MKRSTFEATEERGRKKEEKIVELFSENIDGNIRKQDFKIALNNIMTILMDTWNRYDVVIGVVVSRWRYLLLGEAC